MDEPSKRFSTHTTNSAHPRLTSDQCAQSHNRTWDDKQGAVYIWRKMSSSGFLRRPQKFEEKKISLVLMVLSKPSGRFFQILWPSHNILTLPGTKGTINNEPLLYSRYHQRVIKKSSIKCKFKDLKFMGEVKTSKSSTEIGKRTMDERKTTKSSLWITI